MSYVSAVQKLEKSKQPAILLLVQNERITRQKERLNAFGRRRAVAHLGMTRRDFGKSACFSSSPSPSPLSPWGPGMTFPEIRCAFPFEDISLWFMLKNLSVECCKELYKKVLAIKDESIFLQKVREFPSTRWKRGLEIPSADKEKKENFLELLIEESYSQREGGGGEVRTKSFDPPSHFSPLFAEQSFSSFPFLFYSATFPPPFFVRERISQLESLLMRGRATIQRVTLKTKRGPIPRLPEH